MSLEGRLQQLLALSDDGSQEQYLVAFVPQLDEDTQLELAHGLKAEADRLLRVDIQRCLQVAQLMHRFATLSGEPAHQALALLAEANARAIGLSQYEEAITLYNEAASLYQAQGDEVAQAQAQIGKLWPLATLGRYDEALQTGRWAGEVLDAAGAWLPLGKLTSNMAIIYGRLGQDPEALALFDQARALYRNLGQAGAPYLARVEYNRAIVLRNLGRFQESIAASGAALTLLEEAQQPIDVARAQQSLAITYFVLGKYNEALRLLDEVRDVFLEDGRQRDAVLVELFISDCLLQLRRFGDVLRKCSQVRRLFAELGTTVEVAQAILNEAVAYSGLGRYEEAMASAEEARALFAAEGSPSLITLADLERASLLLRQGMMGACRRVAQACAAAFAEQERPVGEAQALLLAARAAAAEGDVAEAHERLAQALQIGQAHDLPTLLYQGYHLLGNLQASAGDTAAALTVTEQALAELERLRGRLMVEFRAGFLEDKNVIYEDAVGLAVEMGRPAQGLAFAERAKSRALLDLIAQRLDITLRARRESDRPLVEELMQLRAQRDRLYRRWESGEGEGERGLVAEGEEWQQAQQEALRLEERITALWHRLLIHNADYARDASLWQIHTEPVQPYLDANTLLVEYFTVGQEIILFLVTASDVQVRRVPQGLAQAQRLLRLLWLNLRSVPRSRPEQIASLSQNATAILQRLYDLLLQPARDALGAATQLVVVPHGALHYLPFHALYNGQRYLLQTHEVSYLPGSSFLRYSREAQPDGEGCLVVGHSFSGRLPYTVREAQRVAELWQEEALVEEEATLEHVRRAASGARLLHLATHGDFRPDNPLFSGLALADGWLTTFDIFNLKLNASLVTLSACQTGRNVVAGGDELLGLMRAFLYAGAASLVLSFWPIEDRSAAALMERFYRELASGQGKGPALHRAQRTFLEQAEKAGDESLHPYYWAPFFLVGNRSGL